MWAEYEALLPVLQAPMSVVGSRRVVVFSPQATKTTVLAMLMWELAVARTTQVVCVADVNPDGGKAIARLCPPGTARPPRLVSQLIAQLRLEQDPESEQVLRRFPAAFERALVAAPGRLVVMSDRGTPAGIVAQWTHLDYGLLFDYLAERVGVLGIDLGRSQIAASSRAALAAADHLVVPCEADGESLNLVLERLAELAAHADYGPLVAASTWVVTQQDPFADLALWEQVIADVGRRRSAAGEAPLWQSLVMVPYDPVAGAVGQILIDQLHPVTRLAYRRAAAAVASSFTSAPLSRKTGDEDAAPFGGAW